MRIVLISLYCFDPIGPRFISGFLRQCGRQVHRIHFKDVFFARMLPPSKDDLDQAAALVKELSPDLIGIGVRSSFFKIAADLTRIMRERVSVPVVWGSDHAILRPEQCLEHADYVVRGEGEKPMAALAECLERSESLDRVPGLWRKENGVIVSSEPFLHRDLDEVSVPDLAYREHFIIEDGKRLPGDSLVRQRVYYTAASRGCPFHCTYCNAPTERRILGVKPGTRARSVDNVLSELESARRILPRLKRIFFYDDVFVSDPAFQEEFAEKYRRRIGLPFGICQHPSNMDGESLRLLADAGLKTVEIGLQSGSEDFRKTVFGRDTPNSSVTALQRALADRGIEQFFDLIVDVPYEDERSCAQTLDLLLAFKRPFSVNLLSLAHFPDSALTNRLLREGLISAGDVEGEASRGMELRLSFGENRDPVRQFHYALYSLASKRFIPASALRRISRSERLKRNPAPLVFLARICGLIKGVSWGIQLLIKGELDWRRFLRGWRSRRAFLS